MNETVSMVGKASPAAEFATNRVAELQDRVSHLNSQVMELRHKLDAIEAEGLNSADVRKTLHDFDPLWAQLSAWEQERFIRTLVEHVRYDGKTGTVTLGFRSRGIKDFCSWAPTLNGDV